MSGGACERVAAYVNVENENLTRYGLNIINANSKYKDVYVQLEDSRQSIYETNKNIFGDAVYETSNGYDGAYSWYSDHSYIPYSSSPWFHRGGGNNNSANAGLFNFNSANGNAHEYFGFRPIVISTMGI